MLLILLKCILSRVYEWQLFVTYLDMKRQVILSAMFLFNQPLPPLH